MTCTLVSILSPGGDADHNWCGNDEAGQFTHHGLIPRQPDVISIRLSWKKHDGAPKKYIGHFQLHLARLLQYGFIMEKGADSYRVKFVHRGDMILLAEGLTSKGLVVGATTE